MPEILFFCLLIFNAIICTFILVYACTEVCDVTLGGLFPFLTLIGLLIWLAVSGIAEFPIIEEKAFTVIVQRMHGIPHEFINASPDTAVDIQETFGELFPEGSKIKETKINRLCAGIYWNLQNQYLYELYKEGKPKIPAELHPVGVPISTNVNELIMNYHE